jgi:signal transduction histidine kinase
MAIARAFRPPMFVIAAALVGLIALLAVLQYRWLGQISDAERERMTATLHDRAKAFGEDVDRELTRAYLLFQIDASWTDDRLAPEVTARYERWQATSRFPRLIKDVFLVLPNRADASRPLERYDASTHAMEPAAWPPALAPVRAQIAEAQTSGHFPAPSSRGAVNVLYRATTPGVWADVPAMVIPSPIMLLDHPDGPSADIKTLLRNSSLSHQTILQLDGDYIRREMLPALAQQHFRDTGDGVEYRLAVVPTSGSGGTVYRSAEAFMPMADAPADARVDLCQIREQDFAAVATEVNRFATFTAAVGRADGAPRKQTIIRETVTQISPPVSIVVRGTESGAAGLEKLVASAGVPHSGAAVTRLDKGAQPAQWRLLVQHPSGSLERAVDAVRRRNIAISSGILGVLGLSIAFLVVSTRRAQDLARQQLEFVATVSHELRTPLAVIRSAADNLADGVIQDDTRVRQYGELVRREGVRLTDLVEEILEFAGLQSGQRSLARRPVRIDVVLREVASAAQAAARGHVTIDLAIADPLPAVLGDEAALGRVFQNLIGNAIKYGAETGWVGVRACAGSSGVEVTVSDRGIGIAPADQERIFDPFYRAPDVVSAQIQGAGLGLCLVKRIVEAHGGRISLESAPGKGSALTVTLPIASGDPAEGPVGETAPQHS